MKGMVFTMLGEMVEERFGMDTWDELIEATDPASEGIYVSSELYPDEELMAYVSELSNRLGVPGNDLVYAFGEYMLGRFACIHPEFFAGHTLKSFLKTVHDVIHVEVKKLHPDALLPDFDYEDHAENALIMLYRSPRNLCALAEGLVSGAAAHFGTAVVSKHSICMHDGHDHCRMDLTFEAARVAADA